MTKENEEGAAKKKRGPKGGIKHTPGRGHKRKSGPQQKKRFQKEAREKREEEQKNLKKAWEEWDALPPYVQKKRPELKPKLPRPPDED